MKKHLFYSLFTVQFSLFISLASCTPQKTETQVTTETEEEPIEEVRNLLPYSHTDTLMQGSHMVIYTIISQPDDELPLVVDDDGTKFKDNRFSLEITKDEQTLFSRNFTKADFKSMLSKDFQDCGIMDGMRFNRAEDGKLYFNTCVSYPESDMSCPFILTIGPDGSYTITPNTEIEDDDVPPPPAL